MTVADEPARYPVERVTEQYAGKVVQVRTDAVRMPSGDVVDRDVVGHPGSVGVVAFDEAGRVLLVQQYRHPPGRMLWEPPAGILDAPAESALATAQRELHEEAGYRAEDWAVLVDAFTSPGMTDEALRIYLARGLRPVAADERFAGEHEEANLPVEWLALDDAVDRVLSGGLHNPIAVMGVLAAYAARSRGFAGLRPADAPWPDRPANRRQGE